ncbi:MFS transporter, partial [Kibdelosporangium lantanae]
ERRERVATERFEEVFLASAIGMALTDMSGRFVQTNAALNEILECEAKDLAERSIIDLFPVEDNDDVIISYREVAEGIMPRIRERRRMVRQDGTYAWVYLVISLLRDDKGAPAYHITMVENLSELQALQNQLGQQSVRDMLTGVANRQHFQSKLDAVLEGAGPDTSITLLHIGIDSFSVINNGLGHHAGDRMLQVVANQLRSIVADYNAIVGRVGGDEFAILIENSESTPNYQALINKINERLSEPTFIGDSGVAVCVSIGVALHTGRMYGRLDLLRGGLTRITLVMLLLNFVFNWGYWGLQTWLPTLLMDRGLSLSTSLGFAALSALVMIPGYISASFLTQRYGRKWIFLIYVVAAALGGFWFATAATTFELYAGNFVLSFFSLGAWGVWNVWNMEFYPTALRGTASSWATTAQLGATTLAPSVVGALLANATGFTPTLLIINAFLTVTALLALPLPETEGKHLE